MSKDITIPDNNINFTKMISMKALVCHHISCKHNGFLVGTSWLSTFLSRFPDYYKCTTPTIHAVLSSLISIESLAGLYSYQLIKVMV